jgi:hypothetical protein
VNLSSPVQSSYDHPLLWSRELVALRRLIPEVVGDRCEDDGSPEREDG